MSHIKHKTPISVIEENVAAHGGNTGADYKHFKELLKLQSKIEIEGKLIHENYKNPSSPSTA